MSLRQFPPKLTTLISLSATIALAACLPAAADNFDVRSFLGAQSLATSSGQNFSGLSQTSLPANLTNMPLDTTPNPSLGSIGFNGQPEPSFIGGGTGQGGGTPDYMDQSHKTFATGEGPMAMPPQTTGFTAKQLVPTPKTGLSLLAPATFGIGAFPSGQYNFGFRGGGPGIYTGVSGNLTPAGILPPTSTSSVDINICD